MRARRAGQGEAGVTKRNIHGYKLVAGGLMLALILGVSVAEAKHNKHHKGRNAWCLPIRSARRAVAGPRHAGAGAEIEGRRGDPGLRTQDQVDGRHERMVARVPGDLSSRHPPRSACGGKFAADSPTSSRNVVFELGFFIGRLGAPNVCALVSRGVERPSDFESVVYVEFDYGQWKIELARELRAAGILFDHSRVF
jgi:Predicted nucleotide-binding protein containing TIR-like domain